MLIRNMDYADIDFACYCTSNEGWISETKEVFESLISFNPKGCFVAEKDSKKIGIGVATQYKTNGFIGEFGYMLGDAIFHRRFAQDIKVA